ncbi:hypothetical protein C0989_004664 [Termitomyces sp. Mn162]|nr:hypothetical protein C0989_004664 [Termitomyces sp. Mn162]
MPRDHLVELGQGVGQMGKLLAEHWQKNMVEPRSWWELATDVGEPLPGYSKTLAMVVTQMKVDLVRRMMEVVLKKEEDQDLLEDLEGAKSFVVKLDRRPPGLEIASIELYQSARGPVRGGVTLAIGMLGVGLIGGVDFVLEKLVKGPEVFCDFVGNVREDILEEQGEPGVVALIGVEEGNPGGRVRHVVMSKLGKEKFCMLVVL